MHLQVSVKPAVLGVSLDDIKTYLRVTHTQDDGVLQAALDGAYQALEKYLGRTLMQTTYTMLLASNEVSNDIYLPNPPHLSVTSVSIADEDDNWSVVSTDNYTTIGDNPMVVSARDDGWVDSSGNVYDNKQQALKIVFVAGYGDTEDELPHAIREAIKMYVRGLYDTVSGDMRTAERLAQGYRYNWL